MVLPERIELSTSPLPRECSTTELRQPDVGGLLPHRTQERKLCVHVIENSFGQPSGSHISTRMCDSGASERRGTMTKHDDRPETSEAKDVRKQRLSEQLRANLLKRKAQTRARRVGQPDERPEGIDPSKSASDQ